MICSATLLQPHYAAFCCLVFKQSGNYNNDDGNDDDDDSDDDSDGGGSGCGLRRSSCRGLRDGQTIGLFT